MAAADLVHIKVTGFTPAQLAALGITEGDITDGYAYVDPAVLDNAKLADVDLEAQTSGSTTKVVNTTDPVTGNDSDDTAGDDPDPVVVTNYAPAQVRPDYEGMPFMAAPILYETTSSDLTTTGLAVLSEATVSVTMAISAPYALQLEYPLDGADAAELQMGRVIMADAGHKLKRQLFRIDQLNPDVPSSGEATVQVTATHVANDVMDNVITKDITLKNATATTAFSAVLDALAQQMPKVTYVSDITKVANVSWAKGTPVQDIMFGRSTGGTDMETIYDGEWSFDNYNFVFNHDAGENTGLLIRPGKNMLTYSSSNSLDDVYTAIFPWATYTEGEDGAPGGESNIQDYKGVATIQWVGSGGVPIWDSAFKGQKKTGKELKNGSYWKVFSIVTEGSSNGKTWYCLGGNQWIDSSYITFSKTGDYNVDIASNKVLGMGTIGYSLDNAESKRHESALQGSGTVSYAGAGKVSVWDSPYKPHKVVKTESNGSTWKIFKQATDENDHVWYCLGGNQWIDSSYITFSKTNDFQTTIASNKRTGYCTITGHDSGSKKVGAKVYSKPGSAGKKTGRTLAIGTRWQIFSVASGGDGKTWYNLGGSQWVMDEDVGFSNAKDVEPVAPEEDSSEQDPGVAIVYDNPGITGKPTGKQLASGTRWKIFGQATTADGTWYNLGGGQWIDANYMTFTNPEDVEPNTDGGTAQEPEEKTVTLDDVIMTADGADKYEVQHIQAVDLSGYGIYDQDSLKAVAKAYMHDNQIGHPTYSLQVAYQEFTGKFAGLSVVGMYDRVTVYLPQMKGDSAGEIVSIDWDVNRHQPTSVTIGNRAATITNELQPYADAAQEAADTAETNAVNAAVQDAKDAVAMQRQAMADSIKAVTDAFTERADAFDKRVEEAEATAEARDKDLHDELNNTAADINLTITKYKTGLESTVSALDGRVSDVVQTISGVQTQVNDPTTGLSSVSKQLAGLIKSQVTSADLTSLKQQTEELIEQKITGVDGKYSSLSEMVDGIASKVGDQSVESRIEQFNNEIGSQINDKVNGLQNTIDQKIEDGVSSITLAVDSSGTGLQLIGPNGDKGSVAYLNFDSTIANALHSLDSLSMVSDYGRIDMTSWGITVHGSAGHAPTVEIGTPSVSGTLHVNGTTYIDGTLHIVEPSSSQGAYLYYTSTGFKGAGIYVHFSTGDYLLASFNGKTNLQAA